MRPLAIQVAWCAYDWAYSAYSAVVTTFIFATYFVRAVAPNAVSGTTAWALAQTVAGTIIAALAIPAGAIADQRGRRLLLAGTTTTMVLATAGLWFVQPEPRFQTLALSLVVLGTVSFEIATVFYNALLVEIALKGGIGRLSGLAWGSGYVGGLICLTICLVVLINPNPPLFGLSAQHAQPARATTLFAAAWIATFSWPIILFAPKPSQSRTWTEALRASMQTLRHAVAMAVTRSYLRGFLIARMLYTDGLTTLFAFGAIFAAGVFRLDARSVLLLGIVLNISAGIGALGSALLEDRIGSRTTILTAVLALCLFGMVALLSPSLKLFWAAAIGLGIFVGPAQSASRSLMAQIAEPPSRNAMFGLYALSGRITGFIGPAALGAVTSLTGSQRAGMAAIVALLATGGLILAFTPPRPG